VRRACVSIYRKEFGGGGFDEKAVIYKQYVNLKVRLNDRVAGRIELDKTERMIGLLCAVMSYSF
jgi:hypothetical protein